MHRPNRRLSEPVPRTWQECIDDCMPLFLVVAGMALFLLTVVTP